MDVDTSTHFVLFSCVYMTDQRNGNIGTYNLLEYYDGSLGLCQGIRSIREYWDPSIRCRDRQRSLAVVKEKRTDY